MNFWLAVLFTGAMCFHYASASSAADNICGHASCPPGKSGFVNVHLVPHTHDDVGWLKTVDQYYYGARNDIYKAGVQYIIDGVIEELTGHPDRRFIYAEMAFFQQWWLEQDEDMKNVVRDLVATGRLEFINGGWCMNDEATTHYVDIVDQMSLGLSILNETFGECGRPRIAWQIDPFGHSREQALIFAQMGFDGVFFGRLDHEDKRQRKATKTMEMIWSASNNLGASGSLFTAINYNLYTPPEGFCFDVKNCIGEPIIDDPKSKSYNVERRINEFLAACQRRADVYNTSHIMLTMGGDFAYQDANMWFKNMDKIIKYSNERQEAGSKFHLFYSTPSCYIKALNDLGRSWPSKTDDFFPYGSDRHSYWTGYFTSRPALKYMVRQASNLLQGCKQMNSMLAMAGATDEGDVNVMKEAVALMQHHDAVAGTEKQHVANDYARIVHLGVQECQKTQTSHYQNVLPKAAGAPKLEIGFCQLNISQCGITETNAQFVVNVYNSLSRHVDKYVRVPVRGDGYAFQVLSPQGVVIPSQLVPLPSSVLSIPGRDSLATHELVFKAAQLPPIGSESFYVQRTAAADGNADPKPESRGPDADAVISNERISVTVDGQNGLIKSATVNGKFMPIQQEFLWYAGNRGLISRVDRSSGAYIFRPDVQEANPMPISPTVTAVYKGDLVEEIHQTYDLIVSQIIRLYKGQDHIELDWIVGPIPVEDGIGKEVISRVTTNIASKGIFYTDANGRQTMRRVIDFRESYNYTVTEPVSGNYYPINSHLYLKDSAGSQLALLVDRAQGGASLRDGELELMVHRRLLRDDWFGVAEPLNETAFGEKGLVVRGTHYLLLGGAADSGKPIRSLGQELHKSPLVSFIATSLPFDEWSTNYNTKAQGISRALPDNVNLMTFEHRADGTYLIRLEHVYDIGEDPILSQPALVSLEGLFPGYAITSIEETMLGGNQLKKDSDRLVWTSNLVSTPDIVRHEPLALSAISLQPMEMRTFIVSIGSN